VSTSSPTGWIIKSQTASSNADLLGQALNVADMATGTHTFEIEDVGGNLLASGIVTITP
jgi:hypothetical protein